MLLAADVPSEDAVGGLLLCQQANDEVVVCIPVVRVDVFKTLSIVHPFFWQQVAVQVDTMPFAHVEL